MAESRRWRVFFSFERRFLWSFDYWCLILILFFVFVFLQCFRWYVAACLSFLVGELILNASIGDGGHLSRFDRPKRKLIERKLNWMNVDQLNVCICAVMTSYPNNRASDLSRFSLQPRVGVPRAHAFMFCKVGCTVWFFGRIFDSSAGGSSFELEQSCCGNE